MGTIKGSVQLRGRKPEKRGRKGKQGDEKSGQDETEYDEKLVIERNRLSGDVTYRSRHTRVVLYHSFTTATVMQRRI